MPTLICVLHPIQQLVQGFMRSTSKARPLLPLLKGRQRDESQALLPLLSQFEGSVPRGRRQKNRTSYCKIYTYVPKSCHNNRLRCPKGIGGSSSYFREPSILAFADKPQTRLYGLELSIAEPHKGNEELPSLLGRDVINHWYMQYDPAVTKLECTVRYADYTLAAT